MPVYETGTDECQHPYFTMKLGKGDTLQELIDAKTKLPLQELLSLFLKVCEALIYAHSKGILHRDLKPENIYIGCLVKSFCVTGACKYCTRKV